MPGATFERDIVNAFRSYFDEHKIKAHIYRNKQYRFSDQVFDVFIDSLHPGLYLALEMKSVDASKVNTIYFSAHFKVTHNGHQIEREVKLLDLTGRNGFLVVEARRKRPQRSAAYFVPFRAVWYLWSTRAKGIDSELITLSPYILRRGGKYEVTESFLDRLYRYSDRRYRPSDYTDSSKVVEHTFKAPTDPSRRKYKEPEDFNEVN